MDAKHVAELIDRLVDVRRKSDAINAALEALDETDPARPVRCTLQEWVDYEAATTRHEAEKEPLRSQLTEFQTVHAEIHDELMRYLPRYVWLRHGDHGVKLDGEYIRLLPWVDTEER